MSNWKGAGQVIDGLSVHGKRVYAPVVNENQVRAAAGITMVLGTVAFCYAFFDQVFWPLRVVSSVFLVEFLIRITIGIRFSPAGVLGGWMRSRTPPEWVSAKPKRFAWTLGAVMSGAMAVITNWPIHGYLPRTICLICLALMWMESVLGLCLGCQIYAFMVRRGWRATDDDIEVCADGVCEIPQPVPTQERTLTEA